MCLLIYLAWALISFLSDVFISHDYDLFYVLLMLTSTW